MLRKDKGRDIAADSRTNICKRLWWKAKPPDIVQRAKRRRRVCTAAAKTSANRDAFLDMNLRAPARRGRTRCLKCTGGAVDKVLFPLTSVR